MTCPMCEAGIDLDEDDLTEGDVLSCEECGASLHVSNLNPLELQSDEDVDEDDEEYLDDEEEDGDDEEEEDDDEEEW